MNRKYRIMIETTNLCNARCIFCSNYKMKRLKTVMKDEIFELIIKRIIEEKINVEKFILHLNGEPFTDKNLINRIKKLKAAFSTVPVRFTSNFSIPERDAIDELIKSGLDELTISLNAVTDDEYYRIMGLELEKTMQKVDYLISQLTENKSKLKVNFSIVDDGNEERMKAFIKKYSSKGEIRVMPLGDWIGGEDNSELYQGEREQRNNIYCPDLNEQICILSNGEYAICCFDYEGSVGLNIKDISIMEAFNSEVYSNLREKQKCGNIKETVCKNCSFSFL